MHMHDAARRPRPQARAVEPRVGAQERVAAGLRRPGRRAGRRAGRGRGGEGGRVGGDLCSPPPSHLSKRGVCRVTRASSSLSAGAGRRRRVQKEGGSRRRGGTGRGLEEGGAYGGDPVSTGHFWEGSCKENHAEPNKSLSSLFFPLPRGRPC